MASEELLKIGEAALKAKASVGLFSTEKKNSVLELVAKGLKKDAAYIIEENKKDIAAGVEKGMSQGLLDRLSLDENRIDAMADGLLDVAKLADPVGKILDTIKRPNGLSIEKVTVPMGVIGIIYESRPNVTADAFGLCFKTGNVVVLKGGSDAINSNIAITESIRNSLKAAGVDENVINLIHSTDRSVAQEFMKMNGYVDLLIPRGSARLIKSVVENATVPVIETGAGNCHIYIDKDADLEKAIPIIVNAKTQRLGVCNACESLVVHKDIKNEALPLIAKAMNDNKVVMRADKLAMDLCIGAEPATEEDFAAEYLDRIISIKTVDSIEEAIEHINKYHTGHSDSIITEDAVAAEKFLNEIDSACCYWNASTRFTDGGEFGFGAEIGISTQKLHARGPMGLSELTSYKYKIRGNGQVR